MQHNIFVRQSTNKNEMHSTHLVSQEPPRFPAMYSLWLKCSSWMDLVSCTNMCGVSRARQAFRPLQSSNQKRSKAFLNYQFLACVTARRRKTKCLPPITNENSRAAHHDVTRSHWSLIITSSGELQYYEVVLGSSCYLSTDGALHANTAI